MGAVRELRDQILQEDFGEPPPGPWRTDFGEPPPGPWVIDYDGLPPDPQRTDFGEPPPGPWRTDFGEPPPGPWIIDYGDPPPGPWRDGVVGRGGPTVAESPYRRAIRDVATKQLRDLDPEFYDARGFTNAEALASTPRDFSQPARLTSQASGARIMAGMPGAPVSQSRESAVALSANRESPLDGGRVLAGAPYGPAMSNDSVYTMGHEVLGEEPYKLGNPPRISERWLAGMRANSPVQSVRELGERTLQGLSEGSITPTEPAASADTPTATGAAETPPTETATPPDAATPPRNDGLRDGEEMHPYYQNLAVSTDAAGNVRWRSTNPPRAQGSQSDWLPREAREYMIRADSFHTAARRALEDGARFPGSHYAAVREKQAALYAQQAEQYQKFVVDMSGNHLQAQALTARQGGQGTSELDQARAEQIRFDIRNTLPADLKARMEAAREDPLSTDGKAVLGAISALEELAVRHNLPSFNNARALLMHQADTARRKRDSGQELSSHEERMIELAGIVSPVQGFASGGLASAPAVSSATQHFSSGGSIPQPWRRLMAQRASLNDETLRQERVRTALLEQELKAKAKPAATSRSIGGGPPPPPKLSDLSDATPPKPSALGGATGWSGPGTQAPTPTTPWYEPSALNTPGSTKDLSGATGAYLNNVEKTVDPVTGAITGYRQTDMTPPNLLEWTAAPNPAERSTGLTPHPYTDAERSRRNPTAPAGNASPMGYTEADRRRLTQGNATSSAGN